MPSPLENTTVSAREALALLDHMLPIYTASHADVIANDPFYAPELFIERLTNNHAPAKGFTLAAGKLDGELIGYAYGCPRPAERSVDLWIEVQAGVPDFPIPALPAAMFILMEFAVHPQAQGLGYGRQIHDALLGSRPEHAANLFVLPGNPAKAKYQRWGWRHAVTKKGPFPDAPEFESWFKPLRPA